MAMNFKIFETKELADIFAADLLRKQIHNNPESILALDVNEDLSQVYEKFVGEVKNHPADLSEIQLYSVGRGGLGIFKNLDIPSSQLNEGGTADDLDDKGKKKVNVALLNLNSNKKVGFNNDNDELFKAKELFIYATGGDKEEVVRSLYDANLEGSSTLSNIKNHRMVTVVIDKDAAGRLDHDIVEYYSYKFA
ncbi:hypothetical protein AALF85_04055 [Jeotgalicoccus halotolerans]|jgi:6-phosphogluconolactonase/Glucosamine-6-phosphate isomerase/deaminase|uniref:Glucosamine-6-phosphate deaminase n=1 Tax=Jeotgalicoccus nanhaiensis TaxID=568603 RepID=A0ABR9XZZ0_9STAP|nr:hypothetical protein [Jeotgalicoccus nanhaiensis]MBF0754555.1 hypothetical protein [Jeotgalicoccus nanhaiensis]TFU61075.1 hypothetical protein E4T89_09780 [Jeotgalicoccus nanhaiensis]